MNSQKTAKIAIIGNQNALSSSYLKNELNHISNFLKQNSVDITICITKNIEELKSEIKKFKNEGISQYIAIGGDGTLHHLINQLFDSDNTFDYKLAIIPKGTGNDYIRNFHYNNVQNILQSVLNDKYTKVDLGEIFFENSKRFFINILGIGFSAAVVQKIQQYRFLGRLSYYFAMLDAFFSFRAKHLQLEINGEQISLECFQLTVGIGKYAGGNMMLCPNAIIDDGLFEINIIEKISFWTLLRKIHTLKNGTYLKHIPVRSFQTSSLRIIKNDYLDCEADGELLSNKLKEIKSRLKIIFFSSD